MRAHPNQVLGKKWNPNKGKSWLNVVIVIFLLGSHAYGQDFTQSHKKSFSIEITNTLDHLRRDVMVLIQEDEITKNNPSFNSKAFVVIRDGKEIPSQYITKEAGKSGIVIVIDQLQPDAAQKVTVRYNPTGEIERDYEKRTQAELSRKVNGEFKNRKYIGGQFENADSLRVPDEHTDHSFFIRYEGPGWESDKVGYRYYLDWRNAIDVFGKKTEQMVLQDVGLDGFDSYHEMEDWGMDILKVGKSLGVGSLAYFQDGKAERVAETDSIVAVVSENGNLYSSITTRYYGWEVAETLDIVSNLSIHAGTRLTHHQIDIIGDVESLCTGIGKDETAKLLKKEGSSSEWGYLATYGKQSLNKDEVGLAVLFPPKDFSEFTEDEHSNIVVIDPSEGHMEYYFLAAWVLEPGGIRSEEEFIAYLDKTAKELATPVEVKFLSGK